MKRVVLQRAAHNEGTAIGQDAHAVAEHVPGDGLSGYSVSLRIPKGGLKISVSGDVAGTRDDQHFAIAQKRDVDGVDGHGIRQGLPAALDGSLRDRKSVV